MDIDLGENGEAEVKAEADEAEHQEKPVCYIGIVMTYIYLCIYTGGL